jgi:hypothetical protein
MVAWWNGRHDSLRGCCLRACGFKSRGDYDDEHGSVMEQAGDNRGRRGVPERGGRRIGP